MKLCIISDTHTKHNLIGIEKYEADVLIHCGDMTGNGGSGAMQQFFDWFSSLKQFKNKICIAGNHDWIFEKNSLLGRELVPDNVIYLQNEEVIIDGIKFYGTPVQPPFCNWAFNVFEPKLTEFWKMIPNDTDVLITHSPPFMIGDYVPRVMKHEGSPSLYKEVVDRIKPMVHCFGHIHEAYMVKTINGIKFINASCLDGDYMAVNEPIIVEI